MNWQQVSVAAVASDQRVFEGPENDVAGAGADCGLSVGEGCEPSVGRDRPQGRNSVGSARRLSVYRQPFVISAG